MSFYFKKNKYNSKGGRCNLQHYHPSALERNYCDQLSLLVKAGKINSFDYAKRYELIVNGMTVGHHKPDFSVITNEGKIEVHETKGMDTPDWILRKKVFEACYPEIPYIVIRR